jgi:hypothetical protein
MRNIIVAAIICCVFVPAPAQTIEVPGQSALHGIGKWVLDVVIEQPRMITLRLAGETEDTRYWFVIISVTNKTGGEVGFYPECELMTDTWQLTQAGRGVRQEVYDRIRQMYQQKYPFLVSLDRAMGKLQPGEDHTRDVLVVWQDFDSDARAVKFFFAGLSNATEAVQKPGEAGAATEEVVLRRTLELDYKILGDPKLRKADSLIYTGKKWVMR